jgi:hypothetical protein
MKKRFLIISLASAILILIFFPASFLNADPANLVINGDFETGDFTGWDQHNDLRDLGIYDIGDDGSNNYLILKTDGEDSYAFIDQTISGITNTDLALNYRYWLKSFSSSATPPFNNTVFLSLTFNKTGEWNSVGKITHLFTAPTDSWISLSPGLNITDEVTSDFDSIYIRLQVYRYFEEAGNDLEIWFDDVSLTERTYPSNSNLEIVSEPQPWIRDREMTCYQVWINEDNNFEFVFWWEYANNNWVKIYDLDSNEVFSIDMEKGKARFEADLPDGFYTVKTFHDGFETPIQEFLIGKP